ncbi:unnamed protein product [Mycena citricolor]|uniref:Glycoside hydrolase family 5 domain-containing protein n=1 Tax=Mycena citricolor TaxID=2018698 RepID=A0AAD2H5N4_9AGAR|nr:unnamed protein product [Mycena citricolor]
MSLLKVDGTKLVDEEGKETILRGAGLGGWMNMENFISGYPGCEFQIRQALGEVVGPEKSEFFFDKFLEYFFQDADAKFFSELGLNCIRLPFNYHHFEDDMNPRVLKESGFKHLDRVIDLCAAHGIYTILDLHTAPGGQNTDWHSDHGGHIANFWVHKDFQDRTIWLWEKLAEHYKGNKWIAGYNPLNEPTDPTQSRLIDFYHRVHSAIRAIDSEHVIFFDGNTFASDFSHFGDAHQKWDNTAYSIHDYSVFGFPASPEQYVGNDQQLHRLKRSYEKNVNGWISGGCVFGTESGAQSTPANNTKARKRRESMPSAFRCSRTSLTSTTSWSIWLYKDIGFQGMVYVDTEAPYMALFRNFLAKKHRLAVDAWGADDVAVKQVYQPILDHILQEIPPEFRDLYPAPVWRLSDRVARLSRNILVSEFLVKEWAEHFRGRIDSCKDLDELDKIAASFKYEACLKRDGLNKILTANSKAVA